MNTLDEARELVNDIAWRMDKLYAILGTKPDTDAPLLKRENLQPSHYKKMIKLLEQDETYAAIGRAIGTEGHTIRNVVSHRRRTDRDTGMMIHCGVTRRFNTQAKKRGSS